MTTIPLWDLLSYAAVRAAGLLFAVAWLAFSLTSARSEVTTEAFAREVERVRPVHPENSHLLHGNDWQLGCMRKRNERWFVGHFGLNYVFRT